MLQRVCWLSTSGSCMWHRRISQKWPLRGDDCHPSSILESQPPWLRPAVVCVICLRCAAQHSTNYPCTHVILSVHARYCVRTYIHLCTLLRTKQSSNQSSTCEGNTNNILRVGIYLVGIFPNIILWQSLQINSHEIPIKMNTIMYVCILYLCEFAEIATKYVGKTSHKIQTRNILVLDS